MSILGASLLTLKPHERQDNRHYAGHKTIYSKMDIYDGTHTRTWLSAYTTYHPRDSIRLQLKRNTVNS